MLANIFNRFYVTFVGPLFAKHVNLNHVPNIIHRICDDDFLSNYEEVVIIGDIHGCFDEFQLLLEKIHQTSTLDSKKILKICAGDLINKGPKNKEVLEYFMNNHDDCLSVRGNHDQVMMNEYIKFRKTGEIAEKNSWLKELSDMHFEYLKQLPYTIKIPKLDVIIVHAGLMPNVELEQQDLIDMIEMRNITEKQEENGQKTHKATKKDTEGVAWASLWSGPMHIYFGHDAKRKLQEHPFATGLDTGVVYGNQLTAKFIMGPRNGQYLTVKALQAWKKIEN